ncbi:GtrA family protein [Bombella sp. TMW 2.2543]|uniref:GtrA family protein n=1 Tax=Bombella pluederhausensis TaxID=2967336 RepID=A0ABT3WES6_9PROT|nr:GtrA family protein [Bombella pluederhausensis]MCX5617363.1 GtrA family protein [Bombella pluederhausensis]
MKQICSQNLMKFFPLLQRFFYFGAVGAVGFLVDWTSLSLFRHVVGLRVAALLAYVMASSNNWILNRYWTFRDRCRQSHKVHHQWGRFILANVPGFVINRGIVLALFSLWPLTRHYTVIALLFGTAGGMFINFALCHHFVFHKKKPLP